MNDIDINLKERMAHYNVAGLSTATILNGQISTIEQYGLLEAGTTRMVNHQSVFSACSISKFLTSILVMLLYEKGIVDLDENVNRKLSSWKVPDHDFIRDKNITLRNLLSHQSGIIDPENSFMKLVSADNPSMTDLLMGRTAYCQVPITVKYEPESDFYYSDAGYCIIQLLIEDVTGKAYEELVRELIFQPLNMSNSTFIKKISGDEVNRFTSGHNHKGNVVTGKFPIYPYPAAAGLWTTPIDLSNLVIELINSLKGRSKIGLSISKTKEIIKPHGCKEFAGLGVFLDGFGDELEITSLGWGVGFQCMMVAFPYKDSGLVIMTNADLGVHQQKGIIGEVYHSYLQAAR